jgi:uncharacterized protein YecE (DUF72 family)
MAHVQTEYRIGTASWTDPTLLATHFYPPTVRTAEQRLRFYASCFDTVEVDSTYYALPSERNASLWAERTPARFRFNIKAHALLTGHATEVRSLPKAIRAILPAEALEEERLRDAPPAAIDLAFEMFRDALEPLRAAGKLGCILLQFPPWFTMHSENAAYVETCRRRLPDDRLAVEFRHASWLGEHASRTLSWLAGHDVAFVNTDAPSAPSIPRTPFVATGPLAYVRLHGRNRDTWFRRAESAAQRFKYLYSDAELHECAARIQHLRQVGDGTACTVYVIFNNCYADYGVRNAQTMQGLLPGA